MVKQLFIVICVSFSTMFCAEKHTPKRFTFEIPHSTQSVAPRKKQWHGSRRDYRATTMSKIIREATREAALMRNTTYAGRSATSLIPTEGRSFTITNACDEPREVLLNNVSAQLTNRPPYRGTTAHRIQPHSTLSLPHVIIDKKGKTDLTTAILAQHKLSKIYSYGHVYTIVCKGQCPAHLN